VQLGEVPGAVIILDDLHHLSNPNLIADLGRLVDLLPSTAHMVLSSRMDPPIAWSRHRLRQDIVELRQSDLALDGPESSELLRRITGRSFEPDRVAALVSRTEGWAAGVQLAGMSLRHHEDVDGFVIQFSGTDRLVADYLSEEVLEAQTAQRRRLLLRISVLDEMCAPLVDHLTGHRDAQLLLEELERDSMFLIPLDARREWFRFHHLFRDLLRFRLRAEEPELEQELLRRAAIWHIEHGEVGAAVECLLSACAWDDVLDLIVSRGSEVFERGEMTTVIAWINRVPERVREGRHDVGLLQGFLMGLEGQFIGSENVLQRVNDDRRVSPGERLCAQVALAGLAQWRSNASMSISMANQAVQMLDTFGDEPVPMLIGLTGLNSLRTIATISGGRARFLGGDLDGARRWLERGVATVGAAYSVWRVSGLGSLGLVEAWCGNTDRAEALVDESLAIARSARLLNHPSTSDAFLAASIVALERGEPHRAALSLYEGALRAEANRRSQLSWIAHLGTARRQAADGHGDEAMVSCQSRRPELGSPPPPVVVNRLVALQCRTLRLEESYGEAARALVGADHQAEAVHFERVALALSMRQADQARKIMTEAPTDPSPIGPLFEVKRRILHAWLASMEGSGANAQRELGYALELAGRHWLVDAFVGAGSTIVRLVGESGTGDPGFRDAVLRRSHETNAPRPVGALIDPLTDRELEILSYLPSRYTNAEMAERCYVSVNTIKTHMAHIYRKLGVINRNEAIIRAREIGLL